MGNAQNYDSSQDNSSRLNRENYLIYNKHLYYNPRYNLLPSLPGHEYDIIYLEYLKKNNILPNFKEYNNENYIDLRSNFPSIIDIKKFSFNPIACVSYVIHYSMLKNKLPIFPPSLMYIFNNIKFYNENKNILCFNVIFDSICKNGFCSENELHSVESNLNYKCNDLTKEKSMAYKFINIYKIDSDLELIKILIFNSYPILVGFSVYYNLDDVNTCMWIPDKNKDNKMGGLAGVIVGFIEERKMFIMAETFGTCFGMSGFILIPYEYILNNNYTFERYIINFDSDRVEAYINHRKNMLNLHTENNNESKYKEDNFNSLFS